MKKRKPNNTKKQKPLDYANNTNKKCKSKRMIFQTWNEISYNVLNIYNWLMLMIQFFKYKKEIETIKCQS